ncbi:uncharacterized protein L3040_008773 [Drepanopeziza brunnea f. sp. 'multigermtubi']|uniref:uncharacterized protein n=1 Tax=Drepanopeziza brunnea f. sp. 'multigermtubi' TaxID=698441 RepID=UPI002396FAE5|nr:hypothetical protein L3040_008773 [Drepanopeziza brunnea f. sp. 'multigermtubi']
MDLLPTGAAPAGQVTQEGDAFAEMDTSPIGASLTGPETVQVEGCSDSHIPSLSQQPTPASTAPLRPNAPRVPPNPRAQETEKPVAPPSTSLPFVHCSILQYLIDRTEARVKPTQKQKDAIFVKHNWIAGKFTFQASLKGIWQLFKTIDHSIDKQGFSITAKNSLDADEYEHLANAYARAFNTNRNHRTTSIKVFVWVNLERLKQQGESDPKLADMIADAIATGTACEAFLLTLFQWQHLGILLIPYEILHRPEKKLRRPGAPTLSKWGKARIQMMTEVYSIYADMPSMRLFLAEFGPYLEDLLLPTFVDSSMIRYHFCQLLERKFSNMLGNRSAKEWLESDTDTHSSLPDILFRTEGHDHVRFDVGSINVSIPRMAMFSLIPEASLQPEIMDLLVHSVSSPCEDIVYIDSLDIFQPKPTGYEWDPQIKEIVFSHIDIDSRGWVAVRVETTSHPPTVRIMHPLRSDPGLSKSRLPPSRLTQAVREVLERQAIHLSNSSLILYQDCTNTPSSSDSGIIIARTCMDLVSQGSSGRQSTSVAPMSREAIEEARLEFYSILDSLRVKGEDELESSGPEDTEFSDS